MKRFVGMVLLLGAASVLSAHAQVIVIVNLATKASSVSKSELRDIFTGAVQNLGDGSHVAPVLLKQGAAHEEFLSVYLAKNDAALRACWRSLVFSGQATLPKSLDSEAAVVDYVAHSPGTIGYVRKESPHEGVKVLEVK